MAAGGPQPASRLASVRSGIDPSSSSNSGRWWASSSAKSASRWKKRRDVRCADASARNAASASRRASEGGVERRDGARRRELRAPRERVGRDAVEEILVAAEEDGREASRGADGRRRRRSGCGRGGRASSGEARPDWPAGCRRSRAPDRRLSAEATGLASLRLGIRRSESPQRDAASIDSVEPGVGGRVGLEHEPLRARAAPVDVERVGAPAGLAPDAVLVQDRDRGRERLVLVLAIDLRGTDVEDRGGDRRAARPCRTPRGSRCGSSSRPVGDERELRVVRHRLGRGAGVGDRARALAHAEERRLQDPVERRLRRVATQSLKPSWWRKPTTQLKAKTSGSEQEVEEREPREDRALARGRPSRRAGPDRSGRGGRARRRGSSANRHRMNRTLSGGFAARRLRDRPRRAETNVESGLRASAGGSRRRR